MTVNLEPVAKHFWDCEPASISWEHTRAFIIRRLLDNGDLGALRWLRSQMGDPALRKWITDHHAKGLTPRQIRYYALIFEIDPALADGWVQAARLASWNKRTASSPGELHP